MLRIRHFGRADDVVVPRFWMFYDCLASAPGVDFSLHLIGDYPGPRADLDRSYVRPATYLAKKAPREVWVLKSWDHPGILAAAAIARTRGIPLIMWGERPGYTYEAKGIRSRIRVAVRDTVYPAIFGLYSEPTMLLGVGKRAAESFGRLARNRNIHELFYPDPIADDLLDLPTPGLRNDPPLLLFVGSFIRRKGIDLLCDACRIAWSHGSVFDICFVGEGPEKPTVGTTYPFAHGEDLLRHFDDADGLVLPSRHDGWGLVVHEAMARGLPVIVSDACGASQLIEGTGGGFITEAGNLDQLVAAINCWVGLSDARWREMGFACRDVAKRHTVPETVGRLVALCEIHFDEMSRARKTVGSGVPGRDPRRV